VCDADPLPSPSVEVKNEWSYNYAPPLYLNDVGSEFEVALNQIFLLVLQLSICLNPCPIFIHISLMMYELVTECC
jgi:hypothetical protein